MKAKIKIYQNQENINSEVRNEYIFENIINVREDKLNEYLLGGNSKFSGEFSFKIQNVFIFWISLDNCKSIPFVISKCFLKKKDIIINEDFINLSIEIDLNDEFIFISKNKFIYLIKKTDYPNELLRGSFVD